MSRKAYFNELAKTWDQEYDTPELSVFLKSLIHQFGLKLGQRVLDVGGGTGILVPFLIKVVGSAGSVTVIDYAEQMVQKCRLKYAHLHNVSIELQDVEALVLPAASFDVITCFGLFPHLTNKEKALHQMERVLKPGGKLVLAHALSSAEIKAHHRSVSSAVRFDVLPTKPEMNRILQQAGFTEIRITDEPGCYLCLATKPQRNKDL